MITSEKPTNRQDKDTNPAAEQQNPQMQVPAKTKEFVKSRMIAANFGNIVTILMQSPTHMDRKISELRDIVVPALLNNQFRVAEAHKKGSGYTVPVGFIMWANVSDEVDKRLCEHASKDIKLTVKERVSGDNIWIIEVVGEQRFITPLLRDLRQKEFKDKKIKHRRKTATGFEVAEIEWKAQDLTPPPTTH